MAEPSKAKQALNRGKYKLKSRTWKKTSHVKPGLKQSVIKSNSDPLVKEPPATVKRSKSLVSSSGYSTLTQGTSRIIYVKESSVSSFPSRPTSCKQSQGGVKNITSEHANKPRKQSLDETTWNSTGNVPEQSTRKYDPTNEMSKKTTSLNSMKKHEENLNLNWHTRSTDVKSGYYPSIFLTPPQQKLHPEDEAALLQSNAITSAASFEEQEAKITDNSEFFTDIPTIIITPPTPGTSCVDVSHMDHEKEKELCNIIEVASENLIGSSAGTVHDTGLMNVIANEELSFYVTILEKNEEKPPIDHDNPYQILRRWKPILALDSDMEGTNVGYVTKICSEAEEDIKKEPPLVEVTESEMSHIHFSNLLTEVEEATHGRDDAEGSWTHFKKKKLVYVKRKKRLRKFRKKAKKALKNIVKEGTRCLREGTRSLYTACNFTLDPAHFVV